MNRVILNKKVKVKDFSDLWETTIELLEENKLYNVVIKEVIMESKIWTKKQQEYLDKRFGKVDNRLDKLETAVENNTRAIKELSNKFDILIDRLEKNNVI